MLTAIFAFNLIIFVIQGTAMEPEIKNTMVQIIKIERFFTSRCFSRSISASNRSFFRRSSAASRSFSGSSASSRSFSRRAFQTGG
jgi:hypothetical protein